jgi:hypothetical protein
MKVFNLVLLHNSKWFQANQVTLKIEKTSIVRFTPIQFSHFSVNWAYADQAVTDLDTLKFLGLHLDNHLSWKSHIDFLLCRLGTACSLIRRLSHLLGIDAIKTAYCSNSHSLCMVWFSREIRPIYLKYFYSKKDDKNNYGSKTEMFFLRFIKRTWYTTSLMMFTVNSLDKS